jgi:hypothetical protein
MGAPTTTTPGKEPLTFDRFITLTEKLKREIALLLEKGTKRVHSLPLQKTTYSKNTTPDTEALWKNEFHTISEHINTIIASFDTDMGANKIEVIVRLLDLKDNI